MSDTEAITKKCEVATDGTLLFWCPACDEAHGIPVDGSRGWAWNHSFESPTIAPSIKVHSVRYGPNRLSFNRYDGPMPCEGHAHICHSIVTGGRIAYCEDSTHALAGKTIDLPAWGTQGSNPTR